MKFTVTWARSAEAELTSVWLNATNRPLVTRAADYIDKALQTDPEHQGESRGEAGRILLVAPLGARYRVLLDDRQVRILQVWSFV